MSCNRAVLLDSFLSARSLPQPVAHNQRSPYGHSQPPLAVFSVRSRTQPEPPVGATVTMTDTSTGIARTVTSNETGRYILVNVTPGKYDLSITKRGFAAVKMAGQR